MYCRGEHPGLPLKSSVDGDFLVSVRRSTAQNPALLQSLTPLIWDRRGGGEVHKAFFLFKKEKKEE